MTRPMRTAKPPRMKTTVVVSGTCWACVCQRDLRISCDIHRPQQRIPYQELLCRRLKGLAGKGAVTTAPCARSFVGCVPLYQLRLHARIVEQVRDGGAEGKVALGVQCHGYCGAIRR